MAKKSGGKLAGKTVAFVGKFGYPDYDKEDYIAMVKASGGVVVTADKSPDFVWVGGSGKLPADVAKAEKKNPAVIVHRTEEFLEFLVPEPATLIQEMKQPSQKDGSFWKPMEMLIHRVSAKVDLSQSDLRKAKLDQVYLVYANLDGADLRECHSDRTKFPPLKDVNLCKAVGTEVQFADLKNCQFRDATLTEAWFSQYKSSPVIACDFTSAKLNVALLSDTTFTDCKFIGADLSDARGRKTTSFVGCDFTQANLARLRAPETKFSNCNFTKAILERADLRGASLQGANFRDANLRFAVLCDVDLTGADVTGADFHGAVLSGAKTEKVNFTKAKNYSPPATRSTGPKVKEFNASAAGAKKFSTSASVNLSKDEVVELSIFTYKGKFHAMWEYSRRGTKKTIEESFDTKTLEQAVLGLALRWPGATLRLDNIEAEGSPKVRGEKLQELAVAAWSEALGIQVATPEQLAADREQQHASALKERDALLKKVRKAGIKAWNEIDEAVRNRFDMRGADFSKAQLDKIELPGRYDLTGANFAGASLQDMWASLGRFPNANFSGANLQRARLFEANLAGAKFTNADLTLSTLSNAKLQGADLTGAALQDAVLNKAEFDQETVFPKGFKIPISMAWKGKGPRPGLKAVAKAAGSLDFADFVELLNIRVELARMKKASSMLKKEKFQLFAEVTPEALGGIVKSQTDKDLVYSCRLTSTGDFGCCTQNLNPCGGLRGALCKHLLVLIIGLAKAGQLDSATVDHWVNLSLRQKPKVDADAMSATFLKYKGAEAGEIDWRPTETIPEDFYSM